ncbi:hypothetical protein [Polaromonas hydrogenivorans]|uniref:Uncharacterized protein n=1 Tax=Polaromonas hydrogenivorans TaxID=335476 RepID=A0AAU7LUL1_9BURK
MKKWKLVLTQGLLAGSLASAFSTAVLALTGRREAGSAAAPLNAASHWYWGRFTPGSEHRLSTEALVAVYAALAVGLAAGALALRDQYADEDKPKKPEEQEPEEPEPRIVRHVRAGNI